MSEEKQNLPEFICLNQSFESFKYAVEETVFKEIFQRFIDKKPFTLEVRFNDNESSILGDFASCKFTPPKADNLCEATP